ncbi:MAG: hypothetical protein KDC87_10165 [Planctomycetes bacterium]|nr:hypothetical protein [Planctomycetota bacterium]MCB9870844.1 hypothetical protein [Planctomycetota bacterium]
MGSLKSNLKDAVKKLAFSTSVDQLKKKGVDKVNVIGIDRITVLIEEAVSRSLRFKLLSLDREEVAVATKEEFLRLLKSNEDLEREQDTLRKLKEQAEVQVDQLRRDLVEQQRLLADKLDVAERNARDDYLGENEAIAHRVKSLFEVLGQTGAAGDLEKRTLELVMDIVSGERRESIRAREQVRDREVDNLQRRIRKLTSSLEETEHRLSEVTAIRNLDEGISSVYREVQGLNRSDRAYGHKKELMADIFRANLALQKKS